MPHYRSLAWVDADQPDRDRQAPARSSIAIFDAKDAAREGGANVIETNICAAEVLRRQLPEAQGAIILRGLGPTYTNGESPAMLGIPIGV
jgi:hypothetical protein